MLLAECDPDQSDPNDLSWSLHPFGFAVGGDVYLGAMLMNPVALALTVLLHGGMALVLAASQKVHSAQSLDRLRWPTGAAAIPFPFMWQGTLYAALQRITHPDRPGSVAAAIAGVFGAAAVLGLYVAWTSAPGRRRADEGRLLLAFPARFVRGDPASSGKHLPAWRRYFRGGAARWEPYRDRPAFVDRWGPAFETVGGGHRSFLAVEFAVMAVMALLTSISTTFYTPRECGFINVALAAVLAMYLGVLAHLRPYATAYDNSVNAAMTFLELGAVIFLSVGMFSEDVGHWAFTACAVLLTVALYGTVVKLLVDVVLLGTDCYIDRPGKRVRKHARLIDTATAAPADAELHSRSRQATAEHGVRRGDSGGEPLCAASTMADTSMTLLSEWADQMERRSHSTWGPDALPPTPSNSAGRKSKRVRDPSGQAAQRLALRRGSQPAECFSSVGSRDERRRSHPALSPPTPCSGGRRHRYRPSVLSPVDSELDLGPAASPISGLEEASSCGVLSTPVPSRSPRHGDSMRCHPLLPLAMDGGVVKSPREKSIHSPGGAVLIKSPREKRLRSPRWPQRGKLREATSPPSSRRVRYRGADPLKTRWRSASLVSSSDTHDGCDLTVCVDAGGPQGGMSPRCTSAGAPAL